MNDEAVAENIKTIFHRLDTGDKRVDAVEEKLNGNGRPGLLERMAAMERSVATTNRMLLAVFTVCVGILFKVFLK